MDVNQKQKVQSESRTSSWICLSPMDLFVSYWLPYGNCYSEQDEVFSCSLYTLPYGVKRKKNVVGDNTFQPSFYLWLNFLYQIDFRMLKHAVVNHIMWGCCAGIIPTVTVFKKSRLVYDDGRTVDFNEKKFYFFAARSTIRKLTRCKNFGPNFSSPIESHLVNLTVTESFLGDVVSKQPWLYQ